MPGARAGGATVYVVGVTVLVKPEAVDRFVAATRDNARNSRQEPGCVRFDVLQAEDDPTRFFLYEVYRSKDDFAAHQTTEHYQRWRSTVQDWMAQPRQGIRYHNVEPADAEWSQGSGDAL
jgi:(4S)-4-hydroxy-5-phosphonooxypentane-2,3-dione isomerase